jgi:hypothetical protein
VRVLILAFVLGLALTASAQAAPLVPVPPGPVTYLPNQEWVPLSNEQSSQAPFDVAPPVELVAGGCGWGWHRHPWRDRWGNWHWGRCVPNGGPYVGWGAGWSYSHPHWSGPSAGWGWRYQ